MCRWRPTSDRVDALIASLHHQSLLVVLRPPSPAAAAARIASLAAIGVRHVEIAWQAGSAWIDESAALLEAFPSLLLGAASLHSLEGLEAARQAGFSYGVSPILDQELCHRAGDDLVLVPGVMTPTEVHHARGMGCRLVKLFPAASLGPGYWRRLAAPLGEPLPFCIAAGGLGPQDVPQWLAAGVDAVALGSALPLLTPPMAEAASPKPAVLDPAAPEAGDAALAGLAALLAQLGEAPDWGCHPAAPKP
jgi:2-dehydro-3-deoxyphosphogluconate aldolase/(4S)-4-hydroxy-2-oxoglutarate aldolase